MYYIGFDLVLSSFDMTAILFGVFYPADDDEEMMKMMGFSGFDSTKVKLSFEPLLCMLATCSFRWTEDCLLVYPTDVIDSGLQDLVIKVAQNEECGKHFFAQIIIWHMLITGSKKLCGVFGWNIAQE